MPKPSLNIDRTNRYISLTRKFPGESGKPLYTEVAHFTIEDALTYIQALALGIAKINETPIPSGPK